MTLTPQDELGYIRLKCERDLEFDYEPGAGVIAEHVSEMVKHVYFALTGQNVAFNAQERTTYGQVVTDHAYRDQGEIKVLWEDKAPAVFNGFIEPLQEQITAHELVPGLSSRPSVTYGGYEAILGKVRVVVPVSVSSI